MLQSRACPETQKGRLRVPSAETGLFFSVGFESIIKFGSLALGHVAENDVRKEI